MSELDLRFERLVSEHDVQHFDCGDPDLNDFLRSDALLYQRQHLAGTYVVLAQDEVVAYFSIAADAIKLDVDEPPDGCREKVIRMYPC